MPRPSVTKVGIIQYQSLVSLLVCLLEQQYGRILMLLQFLLGANLLVSIMCSLKALPVIPGKDLPGRALLGKDLLDKLYLGIQPCSLADHPLFQAPTHFLDKHTGLPLVKLIIQWPHLLVPHPLDTTPKSIPVLQQMEVSMGISQVCNMVVLPRIFTTHLTTDSKLSRCCSVDLSSLNCFFLFHLIFPSLVSHQGYVSIPVNIDQWMSNCTLLSI